MALIRLHEKDLMSHLLISLGFPSDTANKLWPSAPAEQRHGLLEDLLQVK